MTKQSDECCVLAFSRSALNMTCCKGLDISGEMKVENTGLINMGFIIVTLRRKGWDWHEAQQA